MKTADKIKLTVFFIIVITIVSAIINDVTAQGWDGRARWDETPSRQVSAMVGLSSIELSAQYTHTMIYGAAVSLTDSKDIERRANVNSYEKHELKTKYTPAVFGLIGGEFEELSIIGKLGAAYIDQIRNGKDEKQKLYFAVGIIFDYKLNDAIGIRGSYDNVAGPMIGTTIHF